MHRSLAVLAAFLLLAILVNHSVNPAVVQAIQTYPFCPSLPPAASRQVPVSSVTQLVNAVNNAQPGDTILIADGTYDLNGAYLWVDTPGISLRSASGNCEAVILDGNYQTTEIITIAASNVTLADLTIREAYTHPVHVVSSDAGDTLNTLLYNLHIIDPGEQAIKINPGADGYYPDQGTVACSTIELTDAGRPHIRSNCYTGGIDAHQALGWTVRDNQISGFWCPNGLSEHAVHFWRTSRDTIVERNLLTNNARGVGFGLSTTGESRTYLDNPCPDAVGYVDHFEGLIRNNFISANHPDLFNSQYGFDCAICIWNACQARVLHNTIFTADPAATFSAIEWRFPNTRVSIFNNLTNDQLLPRDGAIGTLSGNLTNAAASWFIDPANYDLHLSPQASEPLDRVGTLADVSSDIDGDNRPQGTRAEVGADEVLAISRVLDLHLTDTSLVTETLSFTLAWTPPIGAVSQEVRYAAAPINLASWSSTALLVSDLDGSTATYSGSLPFTQGETLYIALRAVDDTSTWTDVSNNAFYPHYDHFLPLVMK